MTTAFVLSGGSSLGAVQVGMLRALDKSGIRPDFIVGTSVGALNGAVIADGGGAASIERLAKLWMSLKRADIFPVGPIHGALGYYGLKNSLVRSDPLRRLIERSIAFSRFEDAVIPLHVIATNVKTGAEELISKGNLIDALLASTAIPGVFPPVAVNDMTLMDGGVSNNAPISHAIQLGATKIYVLPAGFACALKQAPQTALGVAVQALTLMIGWRLSLDIERFDHKCELRVVPPLCPAGGIANGFQSCGGTYPTLL